jgi:3',5'-cyclic AMP phosphodiesterase CpdA
LRSILHISDVHFGPAHQPDRAAAVLALVEQRRPDFVVVSGDLTLRAKPHQFRAARRWLDQIKAPVLAVPGNHDVPLYRVWERLGAPYAAYRRHFDSNLEPTIGDDEVAIVGLNTAHGLTLTGGRLRPIQLRSAVAALAAADVGAFRIAVLHHHLVMPPTGKAGGVLRGAARALYELSIAGVDLVLSGHLHRSFLAQAAALADRQSPMLILHSGTTTSGRGRVEESGRNTLNWIEVTPELLTIASMRWEGEAAGFEELRRSSFPRPPSGIPCGVPGA